MLDSTSSARYVDGRYFGTGRSVLVGLPRRLAAVVRARLGVGARMDRVSEKRAGGLRWGGSGVDREVNGVKGMI